MIELQMPSLAGKRMSPLGASVENGMLVVVRQKSDLIRLIRFCSRMRTGPPTPWTHLNSRAESLSEDRLQQLLGSLLAGASPDEGDNGSASVIWTEAQLKDLNPDDAFDALLLGLIAIEELWPTDDDQLAFCLGLAMPGADEMEVVIRFSAPRAAFWLTPGSVIAGLSVGVALKAARWCAVVTSTFTSASAGAASCTLVENLRQRAVLASNIEPLPRLDKLSDAERKSLRERSVLIVFLHGLFSTDVGTFDGFITRLKKAVFEDIEGSLSTLFPSNRLSLGRGNLGVERLHEQFTQTMARRGNRFGHGTDTELQQFIEQHVGLVGWPHDSLAPVDSCATSLASLLNREFSAQQPMRIVFVCHSQGGLLARATALKLMNMHAPMANWTQRVAAIATFGTPHLGAAIAEPGGKGGREMALYLMMLSGTGTAASLRDVLTVMGERSLGGIEDLKQLNASTHEREHAYVKRLLDAESSVGWPGDRHRPEMLLVGGCLGPAQKATWLGRAAAAFIGRKLRHDDHDLVVERSSSTAPDMDARVSVTVASDHFSYFTGKGETGAALDTIVAFVWTLLDNEVKAWADALVAKDKQRPPATARLKR